MRNDKDYLPQKKIKSTFHHWPYELVWLVCQIHCRKSPPQRQIKRSNGQQSVVFEVADCNHSCFLETVFFNLTALVPPVNLNIVFYIVTLSFCLFVCLFLFLSLFSFLRAPENNSGISASPKPPQELSGRNSFPRWSLNKASIFPFLFPIFAFFR